ncbi:sulfite exporter TauE/SafE family protein [Granulicoccus sp. GXG6511]|uniref:sulfite exporter TauE/SafE family protein n=1 Tax=Granulicoccus sp. GXG6511 TaxID=3381351 RepID=UPI003D7DFC3B
MASWDVSDERGGVLEWGFLVSAIAVLAGAVAQRVTGMGFVLLAVPFLVLAQGPVDGVILANWCGVIASATNLIAVRKHVDWPRILWISGAAVIGCLPGALLILLAPINVLALVVALITLVALIVSVRSPEGSLNDGRGARIGAGFLSGFMGVTAGVAGPAMVIYRKAVDWSDLRRFTASLQFHFMVAGIAAILTKWGQGPSFSVPQWAVFLSMLFVGAFIGSRLSRHVSGKLGLKLVLIIAFAGTIATLVRAVLSLIG